MKPVVPRAQASQDLDEAVAYYLKQQAVDAALGLVDAVQDAYDLLGRHPGIGSSRYSAELDLPGLRSWPLPRFPYVAFYIERAEHVDVLRLLHGRRDIPATMQDQR